MNKKKFQKITLKELPLYHFQTKSASQTKFLNILEDNQIIFAIGRAGTGKTITAIAHSLSKLVNGDINRLIIIKPIVEAEENLGFLPGSVENKIHPYHFSSIFTIDELIGKQKRIEYMNENKIMMMPIAYLRGVTFNNSHIIVDEAQNTTKGQIKLILTRIGRSSKMVFIGDIEQSDLKRKHANGLSDAIDRFSRMQQIGVFEFDSSETVRNPLITIILDEYEKPDLIDRYE